MKIRTGFVSNSSSTSFCIMGTVLDNNTYCKHENEICKLKLDTHDLYQYSDSKVVGLEFNKMGYDETKKQFIERIEKTLKEFLTEEIEISIYQNGWYNG